MNKLKHLLLKSPLSQEERAELYNIFLTFPQENFIELVEFLESNPEWVVRLYNNYKQKESAVKSKNHEDWRLIFEQEKKDLASFLKKNKLS